MPTDLQCIIKTMKIKTKTRPYHFESDCFESSWMLQSSLTYPEKPIQRHLRTVAVPTKFPHKQEQSVSKRWQKEVNTKKFGRILGFKSHTQISTRSFSTNAVFFHLTHNDVHGSWHNYKKTMYFMLNFLWHLNVLPNFQKVDLL